MNPHPPAPRARLRPPLVAAILVGFAFGLEAWLRPSRVVPASALPVALGVGAFGVALVAWALATFRRARTTHHPFGSPSALVTTGPFRFSRNPMYVGVTLALTALAIARGTWPHLATPAAFVAWIARLQIPLEEALLRSTFGGAFDAYRARVRRWL